MKKVVNITIGRVVFSIEEDAYAALSEYLSGIRDHFKRTDEAGEIVDDIELSVAEKFGRKKKASVINTSDVEMIIREMGTVRDFQKELVDLDPKEEDENLIKQTDKPKKKLYRNIDDQIIAGVASGMAAYFGIDPVFVRLLFIFTIFLSGFGILAYLVLWIVMPPAETVSQKLEMQGAPVTLKQFEKMVKDKVPTDVKERTSAFMRILKAPFELLKKVMSVLGKIVRGIGPAIRIFFGAIVLLVSTGAVLALTVALAGTHFSINSGLFELPVREFLTGGEYALGLGSGYLLLLLPGLAGVFLGLSILKKKNRFAGAWVGLGALFWMGSLVGAGHVASTVVPQYQAYIENMPEITQEHELEEFSSVSVFSSDNVLVRRGEEYSIMLSGKEVSVEDRIFEVHNGALVVNNANRGKVCIGCFNPSLDIVITTPELDAVNAAHGTTIVVEQFEVESFAADFRHGSRGDVAVIANQARVSVSHASRVFMSGTVGELTTEVRYSSRLDTRELANQKMSIELSHSSSADVGITEVLNVVARHSSSVRYEGDPELTQETLYSSTIRKKF